MSKMTDCYSALATALGFRYDSANAVMYGQKDGFDVVIYAADARYPYMLTMHTAAKSAVGAALSKGEIKEFTSGIKPVTMCKQDGNTIVVGMKNQPKQEKLQAAVAESLNGLTSFLRGKGYAPCCSICGQAVEVSAYTTGDSYMHLCQNCETTLRGNLTLQEQQEKRKKENLAGGIVGALLGSLLGVACIVLLSQLGYVAALSGVIMAVGVLKGYEMLGGKLTKKGIVISIVLMLGMTYVGDRLDWAIRLLGEGGGKEAGYNLFECYRMVPEMISYEVIEKGAYIVNLVLLYIFLLLGAVPTIRGKIKEKQTEGQLVKLSSSETYGTYIN